MNLRDRLKDIVFGVRFALDQLASEAQLRTLALQWLRALDLALHPWGAPGVVPSAPGPAWYANGAWVLAVFICDDGIPRFNDDDEVVVVAPHGRFRCRWTPAPPTGGA